MFLSSKQPELYIKSPSPSHTRVNSFTIYLQPRVHHLAEYPRNQAVSRSQTSKMIFPTFILMIVYAGLTLSAPSITGPDHRYFSGSKEIRRVNLSAPIVFNGIAIGTTELSETGTPGEIHSIAAGHHFYHRDWYITAANNGSWKYLPDLRANASSNSMKVTRSTNEERIALYFARSGSLNSMGVGNTISFAGDYYPYYQMSTLTNGMIEAATEVAWEETGNMLTTIDFFDVESLLLATVDVIGDLSNMLCTAMQFFF
jgi:hypothetical protein